jgi:hypothetical protein
VVPKKPTKSKKGSDPIDASTKGKGKDDPVPESSKTAEARGKRAQENPDTDNGPKEPSALELQKRKRKFIDLSDDEELAPQKTRSQVRKENAKDLEKNTEIPTEKPHDPSSPPKTQSENKKISTSSRPKGLSIYVVSGSNSRRGFVVCSRR